MDELHVAVELNRMLLNFMVLDIEVCDKLSIKKNRIEMWNVSDIILLDVAGISTVNFILLFSFYM
jgi:hypothetical protein